MEPNSAASYQPNKAARWKLKADFVAAGDIQ